MKNIILIAIIGIIATSTYLPIPTIYYNYDYNLYDTYSSTYSEYFFKAIVKSGQTMDVELKVKNQEFYEGYFSVTVLGFESDPYDDDIYYRRNYKRRDELTGRYINRGDYKIIAFRYDADYNLYNYLGIIVTRSSTFRKYSYLTFRVDVTKYYYSDIKDLNYNTDYQFDTSIWDPPKVPYGYQVYVRIAVHPDDKMEIRLETKVYYNKDTDFKVDVCQFKEKPNQSQVYYGSNSKVCKNGLSNDSSESKKYVYPFTTESEINYLAISIINQLNDLSYLSIYIYSETGMAIAVLVVIIVLPCLIVIGVVGFLLKKFGCIGGN